MNVGLAVGLSVGILFLLFGIGIPIILVIIAYLLNSKKRHLVVQSHVGTTPITVTTVGTSHQEVSMTSPAGQSQYELQHIRNRAQFSSEILPPSCAEAPAYPSHMGPSVAQVLLFTLCKTMYHLDVQ